MSSAFSGYRYDNAKHVLHVRFTDGSKWIYLEVPPEVYEEFNKSSSKGEFFNYHIRDKFTDVLVDNVVPQFPLHHEVTELTQEALQSLRTGDLERAAWRLADALGGMRDWINKIEGHYSIQGITTPTGKGFQIVNVTDALKEDN